MEIKTISPNGVEFMIKSEGLVLHPYKDSVGIWTIGIGNTYYENGNRVQPTDPAITKERAVELFKNVAKHFELGVWSVTRDDINQNQFDALFSFVYNLGTESLRNSTLLKKLNVNPNDPTIKGEFLKWVKAGGKTLPGLVNRRTEEYKLYFS